MGYLGFLACPKRKAEHERGGRGRATGTVRSEWKSLEVESGTGTLKEQPFLFQIVQAGVYRYSYSVLL